MANEVHNVDEQYKYVRAYPYIWHNGEWVLAYPYNYHNGQWDCTTEVEGD